jgi:hypothetical protein
MMDYLAQPMHFSYHHIINFIYIFYVHVIILGSVETPAGSQLGWFQLGDSAQVLLPKLQPRSHESCSQLHGCKLTKWPWWYMSTKFYIEWDM